MTYVDRVRLVVCDHKNRACSMFFDFLLIVEHLLTFSDKVSDLFSPIKTDLVLYYWSFCRWYRGVFLTYVDKVCVVICDHQNRVRSMWGDSSYVIYSPTIYPFRFSRNIEPYIP